MDNNAVEMTLATFEDGLNRWGADVAHWPEEMRVPAQGLLSRSEEAQSVLREAQTFAALMNEAPAGDVHSALTARILSGAPSHVGGEAREPAGTAAGGFLGGLIGVLWPDQGWMRPAALMALSLVAGLYLGLTAPSMTQTTTQTDLFAYVFDAPDTWVSDTQPAGEQQ